MHLGAELALYKTHGGFCVYRLPFLSVSFLLPLSCSTSSVARLPAFTTQ